ncbi:MULTISPECIES: autophagy evasion T3SS effector BopA [Burkholderia]|uniref:autophagy evasion T3SS effector BopA n=1 Tax=Burkholderia TaxID=32008 RepID=UPI00075D64C4|nr:MULTISPECIES: autophagy evasion T3SS effector BopA [Burkholderia]AOJ73486.1 multidrug DMT transporter permease [Burkholderia savannae]KVG41372.1 multidrug DMT transporter permease [Burkholderia sp. MSMB0265]KVG87891.1 multidrug DMT transporter permease [Burkholderia sp. MSMB2040]KVG96462.1 multidrug DMT transporter permease [Burkholderia sp. MSMB2041]KVH01609.1 multidrug DMT transporter permease [Burkholderia sp. MSMB2042]
MINVDAFVAHALPWGGRVVVGDGARGPAVSVARLGMKERLFAFLAHVPLLKHCDAVRRYAERVRTENCRTLAVFLGALSKRYGPEGATAALDYGARRDDAPLDRRLVRNMMSIAEHFHGTGDAKPLARQIVFRSWECRGLDHPGHASLTIKNQADADAGRHVYEHVSWWPLKPLDSKEFGRVEAKALSRYRQDKRSEIGKETVRNLRRGEIAREKIEKEANHLLDEADFRAARFFPRAGQKRDEEWRWGLSARKVYFPAIGLNRDKREAAGRDAFVLFGLNEAAMLRDARAVKHAATTGELKYQMISKKENCASMALRVLRSGGAEHFVPYTAAWISEDPNRAHAYAQAVQARIDTLNQQRADIARHCDRLCNSAPVREAWRAFSEPGQAVRGVLAGEAGRGRVPAHTGAPRQARLDGHALEVERIGAYFDELSAARSVKHRDRADADLAEAMKRCAPSVRDDVAALTRKARTFVEALGRHLDAPPPDDRSALRMLAAHAMIGQIEAFMSTAIAA